MLFQVILLTALGQATSQDHVAQRQLSFRKPDSFQQLSVAAKVRRRLEEDLFGDNNGSYLYGYGQNTSGSYGYGQNTSGSYGYGPYGNASGSGGYGPYGYGNKSWLECPEQYCYSIVYTDDGEVDWDATLQVTEYTCGTWEEGCPCHEKFEVQCESYGYKMCYPKTEGCSDPFEVECDDETERVCKDEWSAYCWDKSWGSCPVTCSHEETYCYSYVYDSTGEVNWTAPQTQFCANMTTGCPCDPQWEDTCTDSWGYSWCTPKTYPCPIECGHGEQVCHSYTYLPTGEPDWSVPHNQSCAPWNGSCPCHPQFEELCTDSWGYSFCQPTHGGHSCPITCKEDEHYCWETPYDEFGNVNYSAPWKESCAAAEAGCPCDPVWEHQCTVSGYGYSSGYSWCESKSYSCPVDCGDAVTCWHYSGNTSCATDSGCSCEADELACQDSAGKTECYAKEWYGETCPLTCNYDTENWCYRVGFDSQGMMTWTEYCYTRESDDDWWCPVLCDEATAKTCGTGDFAECVALTDECPEVCTSEQQTCWVSNYDTQGNYLSGKDKCAPKDEECPCGENSQLCTFDGWSYCESRYYGCPLTCAADEKYCYPMSYTPEGLYDPDANVQESCAKLNATCPCGANAKPCKWTDDWGYEEEWCFAEVESCPVTCSSDQKRCYLTDFNASGYPEKFSESCVAKTRSCTCGTNSQECYDPLFEENFCYPLVDFWTNEPMKCPVYCTDKQDYCYIPSFDTKGNWISTTEECVPKGQACDCTKGQNAFSCTWTDPLWGSWTECLPTHNGYCPSDCPTGEVACDMVEDYLPNGTSLGLVQPSVKCAASYDKCPCSKEASRCPNQGCIFKDEGCAAECGANEKKCYVSDFTEGGVLISDQEFCVPKKDTCQCGKNTAKCDNSDLCLPLAEKELVCPCKGSETSCNVADYDKNGVVTGFSTQCVKDGTACPCGKNTISCPDPNDVLKKECVPSHNHKKCPEPCTVDAIVAGQQTCVQINLDDKGNFKSETVTCISENATCGVGEGMKRCPSGAVIAVDTTCVNKYAATSGGRRLSSRRMSTTQTAQRETCSAIITMSSLRSDAVSKAETVRAKMNSALQMPGGFKSTLTIKSSTSRRLERNRKLSRKLSTAAATMIFNIDNQGISSSVSPGQVCEELKKMVKSSSPALTNAVSLAGVIDSKAGVNLEISTATLHSRSEAAVEQRNEKAGITTRAPSTTAATTATTATSGSSAASTTDASSTSAQVSTTAGTTQTQVEETSGARVLRGLAALLTAMVVVERS
ncbi:unnamed protein product [Cladocopium goreaui]|uniref:Uncharacterized protein n=1 Tax=Cladocopium goreaui TaxID=2562237 RepID=A0A9P1D880_9DINO|nr:unnamed protein product [Cladocopium goreaui]